jgi:hypothetical protein
MSDSVLLVCCEFYLFTEEKYNLIKRLEEGQNPQTGRVRAGEYQAKRPFEESLGKGVVHTGNDGKQWGSWSPGTWHIVGTLNICVLNERKIRSKKGLAEWFTLSKCEALSSNPCATKKKKDVRK